MSRYRPMFDRLARDREGALGAFLMAGDPDIATSADLLSAAIAGGADMIELGLPFSDPVADGPVIQAAAQRALAAGVKAADCLQLIACLRSQYPGVPIGILTYANIVMARPGFMSDAASAGVDSLLIADVPSIEIEPFARQMAQAGIEPVLIAAPNAADATLNRIARTSKAYTYCVSRTGITGTHSAGQFDAELIDRLKQAGAPPPIFGFGVSKPEHVRAALDAGAAGVISGSAIVNAAANSGFSPDEVAALVSDLKAATIRCAA